MESAEFRQALGARGAARTGGDRRSGAVRRSCHQAKRICCSKRCRRECELGGEGSVALAAQGEHQDHGGPTDSGHSDTDTYHRCWSLTTAARHTVIASVGAAETPAQNEPHPARRSDRLFPTEDLRCLQSRIDLIIQDMSAVDRSCNSETAADFQPPDEILDLRGPTGRPLLHITYPETSARH